jgi:hypothetical protein
LSLSDCSDCVTRSVTSILEELSGSVAVRPPRDIRRGLVGFRDRGEVFDILRTGVGVAGPDDRTETFFLIDKGSTLPGAPAALPTERFGVVSVFPVGKNGCRLLRGSGEWAVVSGDALSVEGIPALGSNTGLLCGNGEGLRGPIGRRSDDCREAERECPEGEFEPLVGVADSGRAVVEARRGVSLNVREAGRTTGGGSSDSNQPERMLEIYNMYTFIYHLFFGFFIYCASDLLSMLVAVSPG